VSTFFRALEQAERDREAREAARPEAAIAAPAPAAARPPPPAAGPAGPEGEPPGAPVPSVAPTPRLPAARALGAIEEHLVSLTAPASFEAEQYRALRHLLDLRREAAGLQVVAVTSPALGDGKTTTAVNLAGALAQRAGARILLVEADLRRPAIERLLGLGAGPGLADALAAPDLPLDRAVRPRPYLNLDVLPAGRAPERPYELVRSPGFAALLADARGRYDTVVLDTPPLVGVPDARVAEQLADGVLLVVRAHRTPRKLLEEALGLLDPAKALGIVFNRDDRPLGGYYRGYYHAGVANGHQGNGRAARWPDGWRRALRRPGAGA
jgi:capsular exopolysaccharide synthesis family protein